MKYVGSRYMPKFVGTYDNTTAYEALSVVDNGMGTSYVSNKPVPAGTPLTDTNYWAVYGMSSGAILNLQQQIDDMKDGTVPGSLQEQITTNTNDISTLNTAVGNKVNTYASDPTQWDTTPTSGSSKPVTSGGVYSMINQHNLPTRMVVITDSYGAGRDSQTPFTTPLQTYLGLTSGNYYAYFEGNMGFYNPGHDGHNAQALLTYHSDDIANHDTITDIIFALGINDTSVTEANIKTAIANCATYCRSEYPNAKIHVAYVNNQNTSKNSGAIENYVRSVRSYIEACGIHNLHYLANVEYLMHDDRLFVTDKIHPTTAAGELIAQALVCALNGTYNCVRNSGGTITGSGDGLGIIDTGSLQVFINNNIIELSPSLRFSASTLVISDRNWHEIGTLSNCAMFGQPGFPPKGVAKIYTDQGYKEMLWSVSEGKFSICIPTVSGTPYTIAGNAANYFDTLTCETLLA